MDGIRAARSPRPPRPHGGEDRGGSQEPAPVGAAPCPAPRATPNKHGGREITSVIIPCLDEEAAIGPCVAAVLAQGVGEVIVVDGGSTDRTAERACAAGARVVIERRRGYGRALMAGIAALSPVTSIVLFMDGDGSDRPEMIPTVLAPIAGGRADFVLGSRLQGDREPGSLAPTQVMAGWLAGLCIGLLYGARFTDMSPFRAIRRQALEGLEMRESTFGWNLEMQMRVAASGMRTVEVPVGQRRRVGGASKVSGNWVGAVRAALVLIATFIRLALELRQRRR